MGRGIAKTMPDKDLTDMLLSMEEYREEFEDWDEETPVLLCQDCYEERQEDDYGTDE